jgi:hypothetical protein
MTPRFRRSGRRVGHFGRRHSGRPGKGCGRRPGPCRRENRLIYILENRQITVFESSISPIFESNKYVKPSSARGGSGSSLSPTFSIYLVKHEP